MVKSQDRRPVVVTGAAGTLGSAVVCHLATRGHQVVAIDRPEASDALSAVAREAAGVIPFELDATSPETWPPVLDRITTDFGPPSGAVLVAGGYRGGKRLFEAEADAHWRAMLEMNLESARVALQALLPPMVAARRGSIVVIGSRAATRPWESARAAAYAASKAAVVALVQAVAGEVLDDGVRINAVLPSTIDTPQNRRSMPDADASRWVSPASLCEVIAFLLSDGARDVSGALVPVFGRVGV